MQIHINIFQKKNAQKQKTCHKLFSCMLTEQPRQESALHTGGAGLAVKQLVVHGQQFGGGRAALLLPQQKLCQGDPAAAPQGTQQPIYTGSYYSAYFSQIQTPQISHLSCSARNTGVDYITIRFHKG